MTSSRVLVPAAFAAAALSVPARAETASAECIGFWECTMSLAIPALTLMLAAIVLSGLVVLVFRYLGDGSADALRDLIDARDWPVIATRRDGRVLAANWAMREISEPRGTILETLQAAVSITAPEIYQMSRMAVQDGVAVDSFAAAGSGGNIALVVQMDGRDQLIWQVMPPARLGVLMGDDGDGFESAPIGYVRLSPLGEATTNRLFRKSFSDAALSVLREQVDAGVLSGGRLMLPGANGVNRMALTAVKTEPTVAGDAHDIFLFVPDAQTGGEFSAAEILERIPVSLVWLDLEGNVLWGNEQARNMLGARFAVGEKLDGYVVPLGRSLDSLVGEVRSGREGGSEMCRLRHNEYETFAQISLTPMTLQGQPSLMAVLTDASELRLLEDKFAQSSKMEAVGHLAGGVAHDFNNHLTAIVGNCDLMLMRKEASDPDFSELIQIKQNANRSAALVRQLLAFSRKQTLQPKLLAVQDVVTETLYLLDRLIGETITLSLDHGRDLGSVRADQQQLEQALMNLVVNARDAMPEGGPVTIATRNLTLSQEETRCGIAMPPGEYVEISVSDSGTGIDPHLIDRVFDPFFTTKPQGKGTGLGLSTVYGIVKQSGGYIFAENQPAGGARFTILLPRAYADGAEAAETEAPPVPAARPDHTGHGAVMLVEDEAPVRAVAAKVLRMRGYNVIEAETAEEGMELLTGSDEPVDVLISDVVMPGMDGPTFAQKAREMRPELRVILISGYAEESFRKTLMDPNFMFLSKPFSLNELTMKVKSAMDSPAAMSA